MSVTAPPDTKPVVRLGDRLFAGTARVAALTIMLALAGVFVFLAIEGIPGLSAPAEIYQPFDNFWSYVGPLVFGTVLAAVVALIIAVPFSIGVALFISHYAPPRVAGPLAYVIDLLAAVPSVVYGLWGGLALGQAMKPVFGWLFDNLSFLPFFEGPPSVTGRTILTAGIVLAIMVVPITTAISREVFAQTPRLHEEAAMALGATQWETIRYAVFPYARSGVVSAVMLGLGRALGETMAVAMVLSATPVVTLNLISNTNPATIASNIASNYKEATPDKQAVLIATGLVLFAVTFAVNFLARWVVGRSERKVTR
ncbi:MULTISPECIES: phosphate ABC transporter permease subunit PstC [unclassified Nocardioides]|uniref:phosphate ABC transporter permease subunit PstC n=1 Tax=unclassified Nocardioides TaxID=2615069 RepID=UPI0009F1337D|nr:MULTISPECIES: phosphate ABC transporter permease subunit PstC [unclassified Nocardioides]GAW51788.1 Phosphate ABC transporter, permease protein PstC [Nocardioides sp. PD653-B2]GAW55244.1 Phosphate ABC transporter, permease protein PstC [Nocardioides sp. PD653]